MSTTTTNFMDRHVNRRLLVSAFALFGLVLGLLGYFQSYIPIDGRLLFHVNLPGTLVILNISAMLSNYGLLSYDNSILVIPASVGSWAAVGFIMHVAVKFFTTETEIE